MELLAKKMTRKMKKPSAISSEPGHGWPYRAAGADKRMATADSARAVSHPKPPDDSLDLIPALAQPVAISHLWVSVHSDATTIWVTFSPILLHKPTGNDMWLRGHPHAVPWKTWTLPS
ncbi:uncharacterized protein LOC126252106 [Schistocerca nitens]|uniref:uncharacterized protein LOC126252106 n=1 Tax=Schistocerca nitens TaxID=7011 RepID=UPI0021186FC3|nr:uncharacterized protein LOC126252106 [Schistocerca nitens]